MDQIESDEEDIHTDDLGNIGQSHRHQHHGNCCSHDHSDEILVYNLPVPTKLAACDAFRLEGMVYFSETQWIRARARFQQMIIYLDYTFPTNPEEEERADKLRKVALINMTICSLKAKEYREAISTASQVIRNWPTTAKAYFCRSKAHRLLGEFDEARKDILECIRLVPNNKAAREELLILESDERMYKLDEQEMALNMLSSKKVEESSGAKETTSQTLPYAF